jgi:hypothetical protein
VSPPELEPEEPVDEPPLDVEELLLDDEALEDELLDDVDDELLDEDALEDELPEAELPLCESLESLPPPPDEQPANSIARLSASNPARGDRVIFSLRNSWLDFNRPGLFRS